MFAAFEFGDQRLGDSGLLCERSLGQPLLAPMLGKALRVETARTHKHSFRHLKGAYLLYVGWSFRLRTPSNSTLVARQSSSLYSRMRPFAEGSPAT